MKIVGVMCDVCKSTLSYEEEGFVVKVETNMERKFTVPYAKEWDVCVQCLLKVEALFRRL